MRDGTRLAPVAKMWSAPGARWLAVVCLVASPAMARTGTNPPFVASFDSRAAHLSTGTAAAGTRAGGELVSWSATAGFPASSGIMKLEFGMHMLRFRESRGSNSGGGVGTTIVSVFDLPLSPRFDSGVPGSALVLYVGFAPSILFAGPSTSLALPGVLGSGFSFSEEQVTYTAWVEGAPTMNVDPKIDESALSWKAVGAQPGTQPTKAQVDAAIRRSLTDETSFAIALRYGVTAEMRLTDEVDLSLFVAGSYLGAAFVAPPMLQGGLGMTWRWDHVVPAVLPAETRVAGEDCGAIENRFAECPLYKRLVSERDAARRQQERQCEERR